MTIKPRGKKYRIRRSGSLAEPLNKKVEADPSIDPAPDPGKTAVSDDADMFETPEDGFGDKAFATAAKSSPKDSAAKPSPKDSATIAKEIETIKNEGLTGRQLRMARRVAQKHDLKPSSDFDAIRLLRKSGIDPFQRSTMLELVETDDKTAARTNLPQKIDRETLPSTELMDDGTRAQEIIKIQQDIAKRRRRKTLLLFTRLAFFVFLPTILVGAYYYNLATPLYATKSEFLIQKAETGGTGGLGGLFSGTGFANSQDSITVQSYLQSREAMLRLDADLGFKNHFSQDFVDPLRRLEPDSSNEEMYRLYNKMVKIGFDPTEGLVKMEVIAAAPAVSEKFSRALIAYAEEQVDNLTQRLRGDQMQGSMDSYNTAEQNMMAAQNNVLDLQERLGVVDPVSETANLMAQIATYETQIREKGLQLQQLLDNSKPNQARVDGVRGDINRLESLVGELRGQMTDGGMGNASLARISSELRMAEINLETRQAMMQQALQQLETARIEANRQVRYLSLGVSPTAPDEATYPRKFENTVVAFLIFSGLYLMASLTASILREQVSA